MDAENDRALVTILKMQHQILEALNNQAQQIHAIQRTLKDMQDELVLLSTHPEG
jgi:hypothetical protein